jgi:hypothetical protein
VLEDAGVAALVAGDVPAFAAECVPDGVAGGCVADVLVWIKAVVMAAVAVTTVARPVMNPGMLVKNLTRGDRRFLSGR